MKSGANCKILPKKYYEVEVELLKLWLIVYLFLCFFQPPFFTINVLHFCTLISLTTIFIEKMRFKEEWNFALFYGVLAFALLFSQVSNGSVSVTLFYSEIITVIELYICAVYIVWLCKRCRLTISDLFDLLIIVALMQAVFALGAFFDSDIQNLFLSLKLKNTDYDASLMAALKQHRMYGFCTNYTFTMPLFQGVVSLFALYAYLSKGGLWRLIAVVPIAFSGIINARNILPMLMAGAVILVLFCLKGKYSLKRSLFLAGSITVCLVVLIVLLNTIEPTQNKTLAWIVEGWEEIKSFLKGENTGYFSYLSEKIALGEITFFEYIFGTGRFIMGAPYNGYASDVGFVNYIYLGGIVYSCILYVGIIFFLLEIWKKKSGFQFVAAILGIAFLLGNIKGYVFNNNEVVLTLWVTYLASLNLRRKNLYGK